jgi:hypothetical protein
MFLFVFEIREIYFDWADKRVLTLKLHISCILFKLLIYKTNKNTKFFSKW